MEANGGRVRSIDFGWWGTEAAERPELRLRTIFDRVQELLAAHAPDAVALEESFVGADARIALSVGQARGAVLVAAACAGVECSEYAPARVKQTVCSILALDALPTPNHAADALAVAICHALASPLLKVAG